MSLIRERDKRGTSKGLVTLTLQAAEPAADDFVQSWHEIFLPDYVEFGDDGCPFAYKETGQTVYHGVLINLYDRVQQTLFPPRKESDPPELEDFRDAREPRIGGWWGDDWSDTAWYLDLYESAAELEAAIQRLTAIKILEGHYVKVSVTIAPEA